MNAAEFKRWLSRNPQAVLTCVECGKPLGREMVYNGIKIHMKHNHAKKQGTTNKKALHSEAPFKTNYKFRGKVG